MYATAVVHAAERSTDSVLGNCSFPAISRRSGRARHGIPKRSMLYVPSVSNMTVQALQPGGTRSDMTASAAPAAGEKPRKAEARADRVPTSAGGRPLVPPRRRGRRALVLRAPAVPRARSLRLALLREADGAVGVDVAALPRLPAGSSQRRNSARRRAPLARSGARSWGLGPQGLPLVKPPYGRITAYNMNAGDIAWQVANGET